MANSLTIVLAQHNYLVGAVKQNTDKIIAAAYTAKEQYQADLVVFPELALTGYPPEDLLLRKDFHEAIQQQLARIQQEVSFIDIILGYAEKTPESLFNSAAYIHQGNLIANYRKQHLPNYGVFDEKRYFQSGSAPLVISIKGVSLGILICEDIWQAGPCTQAVNSGAQALMVINASPYDKDKFKQREQLIRRKAIKHQVPIIYLQTLGGQDELVFDGGSFAMNAEGQICQHAPFFQEALLPIELSYSNHSITLAHSNTLPLPNRLEHIYAALTLGVKDYIHKNGTKGALIGLSGGIDSALTLAIAVDALGPEHVEAVLMPSQYTAAMSIEDAIILAKNLGVKYHIISIDKTFNAFLDSLQPHFAGTSRDTTEENIQARCRGVLLLALSNKFGKLVLVTANKSELAVGYATLGGDIAGSFAVLKDVPKTLVYELTNYRNQRSFIIPERIITRPPSAELSPNQKDQDTLPPYEILDAIVDLYVEQDKNILEIVKQGFELETVKKVIAMIDKSEYKRRQAPPGIRITQKAFGRERRFPITSGFEH